MNIINDYLSPLLPWQNLPESGVQVLALIATLCCYFAARLLYLKLKRHALLQPMLLATPVLIVIIALLDIPLSDYQQGTQLLTWMIAPLTIALMVPLASNLREIRSVLPAILFTLLICGTFTVAVTLWIADSLGAQPQSLLSLATKSVTTPVALVISEEIHSLASLSALIVIVTGVMGVLTAPVVFKLMGFLDERGTGIALGLSAHIIGSTYALEKNPRYAAYAVVSMSVTALLSALLLPFLIHVFY